MPWGWHLSKNVAIREGRRETKRQAERAVESREIFLLFDDG